MTSWSTSSILYTSKTMGSSTHMFFLLVATCCWPVSGFCWGQWMEWPCNTTPLLDFTKAEKAEKSVQPVGSGSVPRLGGVGGWNDQLCNINWGGQQTSFVSTQTVWFCIKGVGDCLSSLSQYMKVIPRYVRYMEILHLTILGMAFV